MSGAPWFRWFPADYRRKTLGLSLIEHGAYRLLIDAYMDNGGTLPGEPDALYRVCAAQDAVERAAIDKVATKYFKNGGGSLKHARCDREIGNQKEQAKQRTECATHAARMRWAMRTQCPKMPDSDSDSDSDSNTSSKALPPPLRSGGKAKARSKALRPPPAKKPAGGVAAELPTVAVWEAYSKAYFDRYGTSPVRNATVNGQLANLVARLGKEEAPPIATFYVQRNDQRYTKARHSVGLMLHDCEALRMEWATGRSTPAGKVNPFVKILQERKHDDES